MKKAQFRTERVEYILEASGYSRNGWFVEVDDLQLLQLGVGQSAVFTYRIGMTPYQITTDPVASVSMMPSEFRSPSTKEAHRVSIQRDQDRIIRYRIGRQQDIAKWATAQWPNGLISIKPCKGGLYRAAAN